MLKRMRAVWCWCMLHGLLPIVGNAHHDAVYLAFPFTEKPMGIDAFLLVKRAFVIIRNGEKFTIMAPAQFVRQCLTNWIFDI